VRGYTLLDTARTPDGVELSLCERGPELVIRAHGIDLMSNRMHGSEAQMAALARCPREGARVLVGGLGMGYTARAALDLLPAGGSVTVCELVPAVVDWNRVRLGHLAGHPLRDPRLSLVVGDVAALLRDTPGAWDSILLDVDNGPRAFTEEANAKLYASGGLGVTRRALRGGGAVAYWSAFEDREFARRLARAGFRAEEHKVRARGVNRGPWHWVYVGRG